MTESAVISLHALHMRASNLAIELQPAALSCGAFAAWRVSLSAWVYDMQQADAARSHWEAQVLPDAALPYKFGFWAVPVKDKSVQLLACPSQRYHVGSVEQWQDGLGEDLGRSVEEREDHGQ